MSKYRSTYQVKSKSFTAKFTCSNVFEEDEVMIYHTSPPLDFMSGWTLEEAANHCKARSWSLIHVDTVSVP